MADPVVDYRPVVEGEVPSAHASVRRALDLLHGGQEGLEELGAALARGLTGGESDVLVARPDRLLYATDASIYEMEPLAVVFPRSAEDIVHVVRVAAERGLPVLPRGAATSLSGQTVNHAIVVDCSRHLTRVLELDAEERWARVEPGVIVDELNRAARPHGLHYAIDPSTRNRATLGGGIANNSCGTHSVIYGKTIDQVIDIDVVLADGTRTTFREMEGRALAEKLALPGLEGEAYRATLRLAREHAGTIAERYPKILRRVSGYNLDEFVKDGPVNLAKIFVGSEGTLAFMTSARVRLEPLPPFRGLAAVHFHSVEEACAAVVPALAHRPAAVELVDSTIIERCRESLGYRSLVDFVIGEPGGLLLIELFDTDPGRLDERLRRLQADLEDRGRAYGTHVTVDPGEQQRIWSMRSAGLGILMSVRGDAKPVAFVEDTAVPPERLADWVVRFDEVVKRHGTTAAYYGHASVGCLHIRPLVTLKTEEGLASAHSLASEVADMVLEFGGSLSGEHGDGIVRGVFTERMFGRELTDAFRELKAAFDPEGIFNPGKIVDTPPFRDNLRLGPGTRSRRLPTHLDFSADGGLAAAVEQCNGQGACRKLDGAMCPSYMVTGDEEHSTRGRANLLRQVLNRALPAAELAGPRVKEALDLCVECKACKSECPSGVDMARIKYEVLTRYHEECGLPLRARLFGHVATLARLGTSLPLLVPLINWAGRRKPVRRLLEGRLGIHRDRALPLLARRPFPAWFRARARKAAPGAAPRGEVVYFDDTFTRYFYPETGRAAVRVLEALGYRVTVVRRLGCCGRPLISRGQLGLAKKWARAAVDALYPYASRGVPIVGTEPSCLLTLRDEYLDLVEGEAARVVAGQALLLDELIARLAADGEPLPPFRSLGQVRALVHVHCHQQALAGGEATLAALGLIPGLEVELVRSACCGMAGSFGFEAEHFEISRAMAMRTLVPAVDAAPEGAQIAVTGASCRQQVNQFSRRRVRHTVELLAAALPLDSN